MRTTIYTILALAMVALWALLFAWGAGLITW